MKGAMGHIPPPPPIGDDDEHVIKYVFSYRPDTSAPMPDPDLVDGMSDVKPYPQYVMMPYDPTSDDPRWWIIWAAFWIGADLIAIAYELWRLGLPKQ